VPSEEYEYDGTTYFYKDSEGRKIRWNTKTQEWTPPDQVPGYQLSTYIYIAVPVSMHHNSQVE
jgi:hypothetical protein